MKTSNPASSNTTPSGAALIRLLQYWPRKYISQLLLPHLAPQEFLLSGELEAALPVRWRRAKAAQPSSTGRIKKNMRDSAQFKQPYTDTSWAGGTVSSALCILDDGFPDALRHIPDPPLVLYLRGDETLLAVPSIAVVGARRCTSQGRLNAKAVSADLVRHGLCVTSGLALGIDGAAHQGALSVHDHAPTIAVLGAGLARMYPQRHRGLAASIIERGGLLLSEYPDEVHPSAYQFPERNRIISGLTLATVVVEAGLNSGSLITARYAAEQGRDVFAMPGPVNNTMSRGCHRLIQQGAGLIESADDVLLGVSWDSAPAGEYCNQGTKADAVSPDGPAITESARAVLAQLSGYGVSVDELLVSTGLQIQDLTKTLIDLELAGFVQQGPLGYSRTS